MDFRKSIRDNLSELYSGLPFQSLALEQNAPKRQLVAGLVKSEDVTAAFVPVSIAEEVENTPGPETVLDSAETSWTNNNYVVNVVYNR